MLTCSLAAKLRTPNSAAGIELHAKIQHFIRDKGSLNFVHNQVLCQQVDPTFSLLSSRSRDHPSHNRLAFNAVVAP
jgi:hypothetical protein